MTSKIPQLNTCCFCLSLEVGTKIIGFIEAIICGLTATIGIGATVYLGIQGNKEPSAISIPLFIYISLFFEALFAVYLLVGVFKKRTSYVKVWIIVQVVFMLQSLLSILIFLILVFSGMFVDELIEELINIVVQVYCVLVVYSYYRKERGGNFVNEES